MMHDADDAAAVKPLQTPIMLLLLQQQQQQKAAEGSSSSTAVAAAAGNSCAHFEDCEVALAFHALCVPLGCSPLPCCLCACSSSVKISDSSAGIDRPLSFAHITISDLSQVVIIPQK